MHSGGSPFSSLPPQMCTANMGILHGRLEIHKAVRVEITVFRDAASCSLAEVGCSKGTITSMFTIENCRILKVETASFCKTWKWDSMPSATSLLFHSVHYHIPKTQQTSSWRPCEHGISVSLGSSFFLQKPMGPQLHNKFPAFYSTGTLIILFVTVRLTSIFWCT
jgi:hypothetical protein